MLLLRVLVVPARVHRRERGVHALPNLAHGVLVALASRRHASNLAQREVRIRALALSDASTGVRERAAVSHADVVTVVVHLELDVVVVVVVARRRRGGGRRVSFFSSRFRLFRLLPLRPPRASTGRSPPPSSSSRRRVPTSRGGRRWARRRRTPIGRRSFVLSRGARRLARRRPNPSRPMNALRSTPSPAGRARRASYRASGPAAPWRARRRGRLAARACGRSGPPCGTPAGETQSRGGDPRSRIPAISRLPVGVLLVRIPLGVGAFFVTGRPVVPDSHGALGADVPRPRHGLKVLRIFSPGESSRSRASPESLRILERCRR